MFDRRRFALVAALAAAAAFGAPSLAVAQQGGAKPASGAAAQDKENLTVWRLCDAIPLASYSQRSVRGRQLWMRVRAI